MSHIIGIDVSKASLDCAYVRDLDQQKVQRRSCKNEVNCFASLVAWAEARSGRPAPTRDPAGDGTMTIEFADCTEGLVSYEIRSLGISGVIPIQRLAQDNIALCEILSAQ